MDFEASCLDNESLIWSSFTHNSRTADKSAYKPSYIKVRNVQVNKFFLEQTNWLQFILWVQGFNQKNLGGPMFQDWLLWFIEL